MFDKGIMDGVAFNMPVICVGNLSVGGTGKSPMVDHLVKILKVKYHVATLSRGYRRRTSSYVLANEETTAIEIGDEPMQFHLAHPEIAVSVGEQRVEAIPQLLYDRPDTQVIILDDAFQHRKIKAGFQIILTDHANLYTHDYYLPTGELRDQVKSASRADIIVVTKCPYNLSEQERFMILKKLNPLPKQHVFFSTIRYEDPYHLIHGYKRHITDEDEVLLICGIANPAPLTAHIQKEAGSYEAIFYQDHQLYTIDDLQEIRTRFEQMNTSKTIIITTEKDAVKLVRFRNILSDLPIYALPIGINFLFGQDQAFARKIEQYPRSFYLNQAMQIISENEVFVPEKELMEYYG